MKSSDNNGLERQVISAGIERQIGNRGIPAFPDYREEIEEQRKSEREKFTFPFVNQDKSFVKLARILTTQYPYAVLIGDAGIGKSMILDYLVKTLTDDQEYAAFAKRDSSTAKLIAKIKEKAQDFEHRSYLFFPDLQDPMNVKALAYTDLEQGEDDFELAESFCEDITALLSDYAQFNRESIRITMNEKQFRKIVRSKAAEVQERFFEKTDSAPYVEMAKQGQYDSLSSRAAIITISLPENLFDDSVTARWEFLSPENEVLQFREEAGFTKLRKGLRKADIEEGLSNTFIPQHLNPLFFSTMYELDHVDVKDVKADRKEAIIREEMEKYNRSVNQHLRRQFRSKNVRTANDVVREIRNFSQPYHPPFNVSESSIDKVLEGLHEVLDSYRDEGASPQLWERFERVVGYFDQERNVIRRSLADMLYDIEDVDRQKQKKRRSEQDKKSPDKDYSKIGFNIKHGGHIMDIAEVMETQFFNEKASGQNLTWTKVRDVESASLFGCTVGTDEEVPPHMTMTSLGSFFKSSILLFEDSFSDFVKVISTNEKGKMAMRDQFLQYLQTGVISFSNNGVSYQLEAPKMIIGCDNDDPFTTILGGIFTRDEAGLRSRIRSIYVPEITDNTSEVRQGTLRVLGDTVKWFNEGAKGRNVSVNTEAANMLLQSMIFNEGLASLDYRTFSQHIEDLCAYAVEKGKTVISKDLLRKRRLEDIPPGFFMSIDRETDFGGYFDLPERNVGHVHGLWVNQYLQSGLVKVRSQVLPGIIPAGKDHLYFELIDSTNALTGQDTTKGYDLATDYVRSLLSRSDAGRKVLQDQKDWQVKTHFSEVWGGVGGPSASLAITASMLSALTLKPVYKNRMITGTIDPVTGDAGPIGGTYFKGLVPMRLHELAKRRGLPDKTYFLFPAQNLKDLTKDVIFDPFHLERKVSSLPITNFSQAFYLFTHEGEITEKAWQEAQTHGEQYLMDSLGSIKL